MFVLIPRLRHRADISLSNVRIPLICHFAWKVLLLDLRLELEYFGPEPKAKGIYDEKYLTT